MTTEEQRQIVLDQLAEGKSLSAICEDESLPCARTIQRWQAEDEEFDVAVTRAREAGFLLRAEKAVKDAHLAPDAAKGRLAFDAERWFLGKLSNAFSDDKAKKHEHSGPDGKPIAIEGKTTLDVSSLNDEQLRALASIRVQPE